MYFFGLRKRPGPIGGGWLVNIILSQGVGIASFRAQRVAPPPTHKKPASRRFGLPGGWLWLVGGWVMGGGRKCKNLHRTSHTTNLSPPPPHPRLFTNIEKKLQVYPPKFSFSQILCSDFGSERKGWTARERERERSAKLNLLLSAQHTHKQMHKYTKMHTEYCVCVCVCVCILDAV